ncbi:MAG: P1 family peptidase, partial [Bilophila wadsworthia]
MRIRDIARIGGFPCGEYNAVTDVKGVRVGHSTVIKNGAGPVEGIARTGVTVVLPAGDIVENAMYAGVFSLNGNGELSGCHWIEESGLLTTPIALTNTHSLGIVRDAMIDYYARRQQTDGSSYWMLPVVGETWDGWLSDINGMHVRPEHLCAALDSAASGPVAEGCVGGGTGMILHEFKGGIGTSSRVLPEELGGYTVGVLIQGNYGKREDLLINGVPVGRHIPTSRIPGKE